MADVRPPVCVIGAGRAGLGVLLALRHAGWPTELYSRSPGACPLPSAPCHEFKDLTGPPGPRILLLAVPDQAIAAVVSQLADSGLARPTDIVGHLSGALTSSVLDLPDRPFAGRFSAHPLHAFAPAAAPVPMPAGTAVMVEGDAMGQALAMRLFASAKAAVSPIDPERKPLCHAAAVIAGNLPAALLLAAARGLDEAGVPDPTGVAIRLADSMLRNWATLPHPRALTGPVARGDADTLRTNLAALSDQPDLARLYADLSSRLADALHEAGVLDEVKWQSIRREMRDGTRP